MKRKQIINVGKMGYFGDRIFTVIEQLFLLFKLSQDVQKYQFDFEQTVLQFNRLLTTEKRKPSFSFSEDDFQLMKEGLVAEIRGEWDNRAVVRVNKTSTVESVLYDLYPESAEFSYKQYLGILTKEEIEEAMKCP